MTRRRPHRKLTSPVRRRRRDLPAELVRESIRASAVEAIEAERIAYESGDPEAVLRALAICTGANGWHLTQHLVGGIALPSWLRHALGEAYRRWARYEARTLDAAFRVERPANLDLPAAQRRAKRSLRAYEAVWHWERRLRADGETGDVKRKAFALAADQVGLKVSAVREYYYHVQRMLKERDKQGRLARSSTRAARAWDNLMH